MIFEEENFLWDDVDGSENVAHDDRLDDSSAPTQDIAYVGLGTQSVKVKEDVLGWSRQVIQPIVACDVFAAVNVVPEKAFLFVSAQPLGPGRGGAPRLLTSIELKILEKPVRVAGSGFTATQRNRRREKRPGRLMKLSRRRREGQSWAWARAQIDYE